MEVESLALKEEIKNLKQEIYRAESLISVHTAVKNGNETILQAPTKDTLQNMYTEMYTLIGIPEKNHKINPIFDIISNNKVSESSRLENDLPGWLERLESNKREKSYLHKSPRVKPPRKPSIPETPPELSLHSSKGNEMIVETPSRLRQSKDSKQHISTTKKSRTGKLSTSKDHKDQSTTTQSLKRIGEIGGEEHHVPFGVPLWKKRRAKVQMGTEELSEYCQKVLQIFIDHPLSWPFLAPVDVVTLAIPDYLHVIKQPMDLGTISKKLNDQEYKRIDDFVEDVRLVWRNCKRYNNETLDIHKSAQTLEALFEEKLQPIMIYVENNAPLLKNENLQKSINQLQHQHAKLIKQQQLSQTNPKPKQPHYVDASPVVLSRAEVPTTAPLLPEENIILAEDVIKLEMKYMKGLFQIISEDAPHLLRSDAPIVEVNLGSLDSITIRRVVQYIEDCRTDRRLRKNQSRRKNRENKAQTPAPHGSIHSNTRLGASGHSQQRGTHRGSRNNQYARQTQVNSESLSDNSSSEESDSDSEDAPRRLKNRSRDSYNQNSRSNTQNVPLSNSGFEMGGDETPGLTDFQNSGWVEDSDPLYRSYEPGFDGQVPKPTGSGSVAALWEEFPTLGNNQPPKKKEVAEPKPRKDRSEEKSKRDERRRQSKAANNTSAATNVLQNNKGYDTTALQPSAGTPTPYGVPGYGAMNPAMANPAMYPQMYSNMPGAGYAMYGGMYGMGAAGMPTPANTAGATGAVGVGAKQPTAMTAYQYQQAYAYQQYYQQQYYQQQQYYAQAALGAGGVVQPGVVQPGVVQPGVVQPGAIGAQVVGVLPTQTPQVAQLSATPQQQGAGTTALPQKQPTQPVQQ